ncbi:hypothetical protein O6H91_10G094000 [Diphasiastrum complanatum]|nr:hypothetical protein O6H91_10G094000 [Diphasiastrum complanatum]
MKLVPKKGSAKTLVKKKPHKSFRLRTEKYMRPFMLDVFVSKRFIHASIMHRVTSRVVACASTNSKEFKPNPSRTDIGACKTIGEYLAERAKEADCFTAMYVPRPGQTPLVQGRIAAVVKSVADSGITLFHGEKGVTLSC